MEQLLWELSLVARSGRRSAQTSVALAAAPDGPAADAAGPESPQPRE